jgi:16S rRNA C967 or C1407 C5-methylase (RsmB/RsmF family)/NOL1/NOP2/fmu family ribosome biogenesis protein
LQLPAEFLLSISGVPGFEKTSFEAVHHSGTQVTSCRINKAKTNSSFSIFHSPLETVNWCPEAVYLPERPYFTHDPLLHAGVYYVQEASSMFLGFMMKNLQPYIPANVKVLDLCAAPGGKSTLLMNEIGNNGLLVSNEIIKPRVNILEENLTKWGLPNVVVVNNDPKQFSKLEGFFDVMVVDAPCSGSGLFRKDQEAIGEWSLQNVKLCSQRQQRIIADAWDCLKQDGFLIYSTCSYSKEEDEEILDWIGSQLAVGSWQFAVDKSWNIVESVSPKHSLTAYRFYPDKLKGEGLFIACMQKKDGSAGYSEKIKKQPFSKLSKPGKELLKQWVDCDNNKLEFYRHQDTVFAFPAAFENDLAVLAGNLFIRKAGVKLGVLTSSELIPAHSLAVSTIVNKNLPSVELDKEMAIRYLKKEEIKPLAAVKGWNLVKYEGHHLGWIKVLPGRVNNYYPKEWRILK